MPKRHAKCGNVHGKDCSGAAAPDRSWRSRKAEYPTVMSVPLHPDFFFVRMGPFIFSMDPQSRYYASEKQRLIFSKLQRDYRTARRRDWFQTVRTDPTISLRMGNHFFINEAKRNPVVVRSSNGTLREVCADFNRQTQRYTRADFDLFARHLIDGRECEHFIDRNYDKKDPSTHQFPPEFDNRVHSESKVLAEKRRRGLGAKIYIPPLMEEVEIEVDNETGEAAETGAARQVARPSMYDECKVLDCYTSTCGQVNGWAWVRRNDYWEIMKARATLKRNMSKCIRTNKTLKKKYDIKQRQALTRPPSFCPTVLSMVDAEH